jgi:pyruvate/2-oxoglutarate dehydrogenase complex dihydrolipoamide acyltransferase (E2) component
VVNLFAAEGDEVGRQPLLVLEAMKMEHVHRREVSGVLRRLAVAPGDSVWEGAPLLFVEEREVEGVALQTEATGRPGPHPPRPRRGAATARRASPTRAARTPSPARKTARTARENIDDLVDPAASPIRRPVIAGRAAATLEQLIDTPADGLDHGTASVNGDRFPRAPARRAAATTTPCSPAPRARATTRRWTACWSWRTAGPPARVFPKAGGGRPATPSAA